MFPKLQWNKLDLDPLGINHITEGAVKTVCRCILLSANVEEQKGVDLRSLSETRETNRLIGQSQIYGTDTEKSRVLVLRARIK